MADTPSSNYGAVRHGGSSPSIGTNFLFTIKNIMTLKKDFSFKVRTLDFNKVARDTTLLTILRSLTLHSYSGMNHELNNLITRVISSEIVDVQILVAIHQETIVGWALLSREASNFHFTNVGDGYRPAMGTLFEVYVEPQYRRKGIGSRLMKAALRKVGYGTICYCPWDHTSREFYKNFKHIQHVKL